MENNNAVNETTKQILDKVHDSMVSAFELGMKYKRLQVTSSLVEILRQNEFDDSTIAIMLDQANLMEDDTYANIFTNDSE
jgi:hypothetical protein